MTANQKTANHMYCFSTNKRFAVLQKLLNSLSRTGDHYRESQDGASNLQTVERLNENYPSGSTEG